MTNQNVYNYPQAQDNSDASIIDAAKKRAAFWKYNPGGAYTVYVRVAKREITVHKSATGEFTIKR